MPMTAYFRRGDAPDGDWGTAALLVSSSDAGGWFWFPSFSRRGHAVSQDTAARIVGAAIRLRDHWDGGSVVASPDVGHVAYYHAWRARRAAERMLA